MGRFIVKTFLKFFLQIPLLVFIFACSKTGAEDYVVEAFPIETNEDVSFLTEPDLKILDIGNSYTVDATAYLPNLVRASGVDLADMCLYRAVRGGASFKTWVDIYNGEIDDSNFSYGKVVGSLDAEPSSGDNNNSGTDYFHRILSEIDWDLIIIHQVSRFAPYYEQWTGKGDGGYLDELLSIIKKNQPQARIGFLLVHSYSGDYSGNSEGSSLVRWHKIASSVRKMKADYPVSIIVPYGTAIQNLRSSSLNDDHDLTRDGTHCGYGLCRYTAACCYYETLIAPRTGVSILGNTALFASAQSSSPDEYSGVDVTTENAPIAQKAAVSALKNMFNCINPEANESSPIF